MYIHSVGVAAHVAATPLTAAMLAQRGVPAARILVTGIRSIRRSPSPRTVTGWAGSTTWATGR
jgi:hypothetical protein